MRRAGDQRGRFHLFDLKQWSGHRLSINLAMRALVIALVVGLFAAAIEIAFDLSQQRRQIVQSVQATLDLIENAASEAAYNMDTRLAAAIVEGLFSQDVVGGVIIRDDFGATLAEKRRLGSDGAGRLSRAIFAGSTEFSVPLSRSSMERPIGELLVVLDLTGPTDRFLSRSLRVVLSNAVTAIVLSLVLTVAFQRFLTVPLEGLADSLQSVDPRDPDAQLVALPQGHRHDELGALARSIIDLLGALRETLRARAEAEEALRRLATLDALTELPNRHLLGDRLEQSIAHAARDGKSIAVMYLDFDRFKEVNDSYGHQAGDEFLRQAARRLHAVVGPSDTLGRLGGDEFLVIASDVGDGFDAARLAASFQDALRVPLDIGGQKIPASISIGIALFPGDAGTSEELLRAADAALYAVKAAGRGRFRFYAAEVDAAAGNRLTLEAELRLALDAGQFDLHFQPRLADAGRQLVALEALLRWNHPQRGVLLPKEFLAAAEDVQLDIAIGGWVIEQVCRRIAGWRESHGIDLPVAINLSAGQLRNGNVAEAIATACRTIDISPGLILVEVTESALGGPIDLILSNLNRIRHLGAGVVIDEFGLGYASIALLRRAPLTALKLDGDFVAALPSRRADRVVAKAVIDLAHRLGVTVVATGVETEVQAEFTRALGCDALQGFLLGRPMPPERLPFADWDLGAVAAAG